MNVAPEFKDKYPERGLNICLFEMPNFGNSTVN